MNVLIATSFEFRRAWYRERLMDGFTVEFADGGVECIERMRKFRPDVLILEASLLWGGAEGVLALRNDESELRQIRVILVANGTRAGELYRLSRYPVNDFLMRVPSDSQLARRIRTLVLDGDEVLV